MKQTLYKENKKYYTTDKWKSIATECKHLANNKCSECEATVNLQAHHLTYDRIGNELQEDLQCLCNSCHIKKHSDKSNSSPILSTIQNYCIVEIYNNLDSNLTRYIRGENMISTEFKQTLIKNLGADTYILYEYFYDTSKANSRLIPTDNKAIGDKFNWSASKVARLKAKLKKESLLLIIKESTIQGTTLYKVLLNPSLIERYKKTGELPDEIEIIGKEDRGELYEK